MSYGKSRTKGGAFVIAGEGDASLTL